MNASRLQPLWTCPKCGAKLVTKNLWHSCGKATLQDWKSRMGPRARQLYNRFEQMIAACGEYHVAPAKTRIAFLGRVRFAGITSLSEKGMSCTFAFPQPLDSPRFAKVEQVAADWWVHRLRITDPQQLDAEIQAWLAQSYRLMGMQERFEDSESCQVPARKGRGGCVQDPSPGRRRQKARIRKERESE